MDLVEKPCLKEHKENKDDFNISFRLPHSQACNTHKQRRIKKDKIKKKFKSDILNMIYTCTHSYIQYTYTYNQYIHISGKMINNCAPGALRISLLRKAKAKG